MSENYNVLEAIQRGDLEGLREALERDPGSASARNANGISAVVLARYAQRLDMLEMLQAASPPLDLFEAAILGDEACLDEHLQAQPGAARSWSPDGFTALHLAAFFGQPAAAASLLEAGADAGAVSRNPMSVTPLHSAAAARQRAIVAQLLERGADPNAVQVGGWTPLHSAAHLGDAEMVEMLLARGADPLRKSDDGRDAAAMAEERDHHALAARLRQATPQG
jgi:ankyrin repeat protein